jgi:hypothetical protein
MVSNRHLKVTACRQLSWATFALVLWLALATEGNSQKAKSVAVVTTAQQFKTAMDSGVAHVHITQHLNLTNLVPETTCLHSCTLFRPKNTLKSLTVRSSLSRQQLVVQSTLGSTVYPDTTNKSAPP